MDKLINSGADSLHLTRAFYEQMLDSIKKVEPIEACGMLFGHERIVTLVVPITNTLNSPTRYKMDPREQWNAFKLMEESNLEMLGIYHSHPTGPEYPSPTDISEAYYPEAAQLIWYKQEQNWYCKAYYIKSGAFTRTHLLISS